MKRPDPMNVLSLEKRRPLSTGRPTAKDVARHAGVALGTVSRVTSGNPTVAAAIRVRVLAAIEQLGYQPNATAQSMRTAQTKLIGCLVSDLSNPLYASILKAAEGRLSQMGYTLIIASTDDRTEREIALLAAFARRRIDGLIAVFSDEQDPHLLRAIAGLNLPVLLLEREMAIQADSVVTDHEHGTQDATELLISLGHRRIALITGPQATRSGRVRVAGYKAALAAASQPIDEALIRTESLTSRYAFLETRALLALSSPATAIISGGNLMLTGVLRALSLAGLAIPQDMSVISSGDTELAEFAAPPITVIRWSLPEFGEAAADLLVSRIQQPDRPPRHVVLTTSLVLRASCAPPRDNTGLGATRPRAEGAVPREPDGSGTPASPVLGVGSG